MKHKHELSLIILLLAVVGLVLAALVHGHTIAVLEPKGLIAGEQRQLMVFATLLSLLIIVPVFALTFFIAWRYRAGNKKARYTPDWDGNAKLELTWWAIPCMIIFVLGVITWQTSHSLDPYKPLASAKPPLTIQVVALPWKWLFIYPEQQVASVNFVQFPTDTPLSFEITSDAPMNSFWIPQLGGQVYAMAGMKTKLHLLASEPGSYQGSSANLSGNGFSGMKFIARASSQADFEAWLKAVRRSPQALNSATYRELAKPSRDNPVAYYTLAEKDLHTTIMMKYMEPGHQDEFGVHDHANLPAGMAHH